MGRGKLYTKNDLKRESEIKGNPVAGKESYRSGFRRDYARLVHSPSFRRLQGKTQLFPSHESDFFRNRLTHSLEVAQIAKSIAIKLNSTHDFFKKHPIDLDLVEFAGLAHDLGHPPFGHNGEACLDQLMLKYGGFEGNAQTLRLITRIEKKATEEFPLKSQIPAVVDQAGRDMRLGLNLTHRSIASILKYDKSIPETEQARRANSSDRSPVKGYYLDDQDIVKRIKASVAPSHPGTFKTIECHIMDIADDIAYSTYDIEDAFKANFLTPLTMMSMDDDFKERIAKKVRDTLQKRNTSSGTPVFSASDVNDILGTLFARLLGADDVAQNKLASGVTLEEATFLLSTRTFVGSQALAHQGYLRTEFTSDLVGRFIAGVEAIPNEIEPSMTVVRLNEATLRQVDTLKHFAFELLISSPMLKLSEKRADKIIGDIFNCLIDDSKLLPSDCRDLYDKIDKEMWHARVVCDYISGMTDRHCVEMYTRLIGEHPITIWRPH